MTLQFFFDVEKDVANYHIQSGQVNQPARSKTLELYVSEFGEGFEDVNLKKFITRHIAEHNIDMAAEVKRIEAAWRPIAEEYFKRVERIFGVVAPVDVVRVFLTTERGCGYNISKNFFFVSVAKTAANQIIMHELLHFWTWYAFHDEVESGRMTKEKYNDVKESLTELLNIEFKDLMGEAHDRGYPQHQEMRAIVRKTWMETKDIKKVFAEAAKMN